jgi:hypothetical protein
MNLVSKNLLIGIIFVLLVGFGFWYFSNQQPEVTPSDVTPEGETIVTLSEQNDSGETGTATLVEADGSLTVTLSMEGSPTDVPQPAHIHVGACPDVGAIAYPLNNVVNGSSETTLNTTLATLESEVPLAINVHKSVPEASVYTSCGDLQF